MADGAPQCPAIKFCGLTRDEDARAAELCGAAYLGVIFAGGPRHVDVLRAAEVLGEPTSVVRARRVGVFGHQPVEEIAEMARRLALDVVQLHADPRVVDLEAMRLHFAGDVWAAVRIAGTTLPEHAPALFAAADAVVLDARVPGSLGGTGVALDWAAVAGAIAPLRRTGVRVVLAGGLTHLTVGRAIAAMSPDVVDVSSGVEQVPGIKDPQLLRAFASAVRAATTREMVLG